METIEDIILDHDRRGISLLREHLPINFCGSAAEILSENSGTVFIVTGFYILAAEATETDGPPGAVVIGEALSKLDYKVVYISDLYTTPLIRSVVGNSAEVVDFPIFSNEESNNFANELSDLISGKEVIGHKEYDYPKVQDGVRGMKFLEAVVKSSENRNQWVKIS